MVIIIRCPYCGTNFQMDWEYDEKEQELVVKCPSCERIILRTQGFSKLEKIRKEVEMKISKKLKKKLQEVFESKKEIEEWLNTPLEDLNGKKPTEVLKEKNGERIILELLIKLEHGIPS